MPYYDQIRPARVFNREASNQNMEDFEALQRSPSWESAASRWGAPHSFACSVFCTQPNQDLPMLRNWLVQVSNTHISDQCLVKLIQGPHGGVEGLKELSELQIVRANQPESLGYVWAALAPLLRQEQAGGARTMTSARPARERRQPDREGYVASEELRASDSPPERSISPSRTPSSIGYTEKSSAPLVEDFTVRFVTVLSDAYSTTVKNRIKGHPLWSIATCD